MEKLLYNLWFHGLSLKRSDKIDILNSGFSPMDFYNMTVKDYINLGMNFIEGEKLKNSKDLNEYIKMVDYLKDEDIGFILYRDKEYPEELIYIPDPPVGLFIKGQFPDGINRLSVVGARKSSDYGKTVAYKFSYELASKGIDIVSGMARGIDTCAHRGTLDAKGRTIAVLGSGFKNIYPTQNKSLFEEISHNGCVITEYMPEVRPWAYNFPERNRIISGLGKYVLVIEASEKSGSLITAGLALDQGKDVFAVPGNIFSSNSRGCNNLIRDGAKIITSVEDILEEFNLDKINRNINNYTNEEKMVLEYLCCGGSSFGSIIENISLNTDIILSTLSKLECRGIIKKTYGNYFIVC